MSTAEDPGLTIDGILNLMSTRKASIGGLMWLILVVGVGLAVVRDGPESRWLARYWLWLMVASLGLPYLWFIVVPRGSLRLAGGSRERQRYILRWVVGTPAPRGLKCLARYLLGVNQQVGRLYEDAEASFRAILQDSYEKLDPGFESDVRQRLADTIDALGQGAEAADERKRAIAVLVGGVKSPLALQSQGKLLDRQNRYDEAAAAYERALELTSPRNGAARAQLMMRLVLSHFNAGRPGETVRWAEAVIEQFPDVSLARSARRMAALGCGNLGRVEDAERHARAAVELADSAKERAGSLALLGEFLVRRGDLDEGEGIAREADSILPDQDRLPWTVVCHSKRLRGHLDEALRALEHARTIVVGHIPAAQRRVNAVLDKELAMLHAELGHRCEALALLAEAEPEVAGDSKLSAGFDAMAALVHALLGDVESALSWIDSADSARAPPSRKTARPSEMCSG